MISLKESTLQKIKLHARKAYPEECCGILLGKDQGEQKEVNEILELTNEKQEERKRRYLISPEGYKLAETEARKRGLEILGLYHSHPNHPARPSAFDLEHALPYWSYVIVAVDKGDPADIFSWVLKDDRSAFAEERITIVEEEFAHNSKK